MSFEFKKASKYDIHIKHTANGGMIVQVGCAEVSFSNWGDMLDAMRDYYSNPERMEKEYNKSSATCDQPEPMSEQAAYCEAGCSCEDENFPVGSGNRLAHRDERRARVSTSVRGR